MRKLLFLSALAGVAVAIKKALEDKGGSYEAPSTAPSSASVPTPPIPTVETADQVVAQRPVENLDEFADPVEPPVETPAEPPVKTPAAETAPTSEPEPEPEAVAVAVAEEVAPEDPKPRSRPRHQPPTAGTLSDARTPEELHAVEDTDTGGKINPFGIR